MARLDARVAALLDPVIGTAVAKQRVVGAVVLVAQGGAVIYGRAAGAANLQAGTAVTLDTVFRLASVTKPIVATAALAMVADGYLSLHQQVADILPWFRPRSPDGDIRAMTIHHLLTHTAGLRYDYAPDTGILEGLRDGSLTLEENLHRVSELPLDFAPGTAWRYSIATDVLGAVLSAVDGASLEEVVARRATRPAGMSATCFSADRARPPATAYCDGVAGAVPMPDPYHMVNPNGAGFHFSPGRAFNPAAFQSGGAGMSGRQVTS